MPPWLRVAAAAVEVRVHVVPRASRDRIAGIQGDRLKIQVTAPPVEGAANLAVARLVAGAAGLPARAATVSAGATSRTKTVRLDCGDPAAVARRLAAAAPLR
jgi:hypothetical protein